ncbi:MAG: 2-dehydro-3-deoxy-D-arabinonate dehydratase [Pseudonocardiales bacterium]|jgi:2-dehydro-3-deoxy-D-arabinonate dehydratase|nr:2-dehydro-3-deoxy-D-arabinonate dehydratase [Pseudonocardiales bacterium]
MTGYLERRNDVDGRPRWVLGSDAGSRVLPVGTRLVDVFRGLDTLAAHGEGAEVLDPAGDPLAPVDSDTEVWAAGVTYERSLHARVEESGTPDIYDRVYAAERPELFVKSVGWRVSGPGQAISVRADSEWNVPEPELAAVLDPDGKIFGWTICNDVSSRSIEAENPLYLPQAKVYLGGCALGPAIVLSSSVPDPYALTISLTVSREAAVAWTGSTSTSQLRRRVDVLAEYLFRADVFPHGAVLATGTSLVPESSFSLSDGDVVRIAIDGIGELMNPTVRGLVPDHEQRAAAMTQ